MLCTLAELLLSPIGQSVTTKLAPAVFGTQMIALFFLSVSLGTTLSGILAGFYTEGNEITYFLALGGTAIVLGVALAIGATSAEEADGRGPLSSAPSPNKNGGFAEMNWPPKVGLNN